MPKKRLIFDWRLFIEDNKTSINKIQPKVK